MFTSAVTLSAQNQYEEPKTGTNFWQTARNLLTGRVFQNWEAKVLVFVVATKVICAVLCFFSGQWTFSLIFLATAAFDVILRNIVLEHVNLRGAAAGLFDTNSDLKLTQTHLGVRIAHLTEENKKFQAQLKQLETERNNFKKSNKEYEKLNQTHLELIAEMKKDAQFITTTCGQLIKNGTTATKTQIAQYNKAVENFKKYHSTAMQLQEQQEKGVENFVKELTAALQKIDAHGLQAGQELGNLQAEVGHLKKERGEQIKYYEEARKEWQKRHDEMAQQIQDLREENKKLQEIMGQLGKVVANANTATTNNLEASTALKSLIQGVNKLIYKPEYLTQNNFQPLTPMVDARA